MTISMLSIIIPIYNVEKYMADKKYNVPQCTSIGK